MNYKWKKIIAFCIALFLGIELFGNSWSVQRTYAISKKLKVNKKKIVVLVKKIATIKKGSIVKYTNKKLKKKKSYFFKIRAYRVSGKKKVYGKYSSIVKVTIKK